MFEISWIKENIWLVILSCAWIGFLAILWRGVAIKQLFNFPIHYIFLGADIGGYTKGYQLRRYGLIGAPDAVFFDVLSLRYVVAEYKSRKLTKEVNWREFYQVTLYAGMLNRIYLRKPKIVICYAGGELKEVKYRKDNFKKLLKLRTEVSYAKQHWRPKIPIPLQSRRH